MAVNFATKIYTNLNLFDMGYAAEPNKPEIREYEYENLTGFMFINYTILIAIMLLIGIGAYYVSSL